MTFSRCLSHVPGSEHRRIEDAFALGERMHSDQKRLSGDPFFSHPIAVAQLLAGLGADSDTIIAALLHDTVEDTPLTLREIEDQFGGDVRLLIEGVTKLTGDELNAQPTRDEQVETLRKIFTLMQNDVRIMVIKLADRLHNMQTIAHLPDDRRTVYARETLDIYAKIAERLCMRDVRDALMALCYRALEPETFLRMEHEEQECHSRANGIIESMAQRLAENCSCLPHRANMLYEQRSWDHIRAQLDLRGAVVSGFPALSIIFVCESLDHCYRMLGCLHQTWLREAMSFQDYMNAQALNGYKGLHTTIILEDGTRVRCKIRTYDMQDYARNGIAMRCFADRASPLADLLPWTKRIAPLAHDTRTVKEDFWESLVNDILGDSIVIHGTGDQSVLVPKIATALDAAFYFFNETALRASAIKLNGKVVPPYAPIAHANSIDITLADTPQFTHKWLHWVKTGLGIARVREALERQPRERKIEIGRQLLQEVFRQRKSGLLEEFGQRTLQSGAHALGFASVEEMLSSIAEAKLDAEDAYAALFQSTRKTALASHQRSYVVRFTILKQQTPQLYQLLYPYTGYALQLRSSTVHGTIVSPELIGQLSCQLSTEQLAAIKQELHAMEAQNIEIIPQSKVTVALTIAVILLWALNPVIAKWFLLHGMQPLALGTLRLLTFFGFAVGYFVFWRVSRRTKFSPIRNLLQIASLPTLGWVGMTFFNYFALSTMLTPSIHLTILRFNTLLLPTLAVGRRRLGIRIPLEWFAVLLTLTTVLLFIVLGIGSVIGIALSVLALLSYTFYSLSTERALQTHSIGIRQPYLLFQMGILLGIVGLLLIPLQASASLWNALTLPAVLYVFLCVCVPHACYSLLLKNVRFTHFSDMLLLEPLLAMLFESLLLGIVLPIPLYILVAAVLGSLLYLRRRMIVLPMQIAGME